MSADLKQIEKLAADAVSRLGEHAASVLIIVTADVVTSDGKSLTKMFSRGAGNFYAQKGSAAEWLESNQARTMVYELNEMRPPEPPTDDGESWKNG